MESHRWSAVSRHLTSHGTVTYERCVCGGVRVVVDGRPHTRTVYPHHRADAAAQPPAQAVASEADRDSEVAAAGRGSRRARAGRWRLAVR